MGVYDCDNYNDLMARIDKVKPLIRQLTPPTQISGTSDPISRQDAIDVVSEGCQEWRGIFERCKEKLLSLPSAQLGIIHCKDCKFSNEDIFDRGLYCKHEDALFDVEDDHYCSWAERK